MSAQFNAPDKFFTATFNAGTTVKAPESDYDRKLKPDSWGEALHDAADRGEVPRKAVPVMMVDYMGPSLDTTIFAITSAVWLFAQHPDQWDLVRENLKLSRAR
jgi:cytochrome P450